MLKMTALLLAGTALIVLGIALGSIIATRVIGLPLAGIVCLLGAILFLKALTDQVASPPPAAEPTSDPIPAAPDPESRLVQLLISASASFAPELEQRLTPECRRHILQVWRDGVDSQAHAYADQLLHHPQRQEILRQETELVLRVLVAGVLAGWNRLEGIDSAQFIHMLSRRWRHWLRDQMALDQAPDHPVQWLAIESILNRIAALGGDQAKKAAPPTGLERCGMCRHANHGTQDAFEGLWACPWIGSVHPCAACLLKYSTDGKPVFELFTGDNGTWNISSAALRTIPHGYETRPVQRIAIEGS